MPLAFSLRGTNKLLVCKMTFNLDFYCFQLKEPWLLQVLSQALVGGVPWATFHALPSLSRSHCPAPPLLPGQGCSLTCPLTSLPTHLPISCAQSPAPTKPATPHQDHSFENSWSVLHGYSCSPTPTPAILLN